MTVEVTATVIVNAPAKRVFDAFTSWERQGEWIPFTKVRLVSGDGAVGTVIEAVTSGLRDQMRIERIDPPYEVRVVHFGRILRGPGVMRCTPMDGDRAQVAWHEWFDLPGGRLAWLVAWPVSKISLTMALKRFAKLVEAGLL